MNPLVSIVIPTYLRYDFLTRCLKSVINQSYTNWECIIVDDGSNLDAIRAIKDFIKIDRRIKLFKRPEKYKKGPSSCRNLGIKKSNGKYLQFFDDDDLMYPNLLKDKVKEMEEKQFDVLVSPLDFFSVKDKKITNKNNVFSQNVIKSYVLGDISWYVSGPLWLKSFITEFFDESVQTLDDWDFNLRNIYKNPKIGFLNQSYQQYRINNIDNTLSELAQFGDEIQITSIFNVYKKHFLLLKGLRLLSNELYFRFYKLLIPLLRISLINKLNISREIFYFLIKNTNKNISSRFFKVFIGYYTYKFFDRGYNLVKF